MASIPTKSARNSKVRRSAGAAKVLGTTKDGVRILKPRGKATHFTDKELRDAIASVRAAKQA